MEDSSKKSETVDNSESREINASESRQENFTIETMEENKEELLKEVIKKQSAQLSKSRTQLKELAEECKQLLQYKQNLGDMIKEITPFDDATDLNGFKVFLLSLKEQNRLLKTELSRLRKQEHCLTAELQESKEVIALDHQTKMDVVKEYERKIAQKDCDLQCLQEQLTKITRELDDSKLLNSNLDDTTHIIEHILASFHLKIMHEVDLGDKGNFITESILAKFQEKDLMICELKKEKDILMQEKNTATMDKENEISQLRNELINMKFKYKSTIEEDIADLKEKSLYSTGRPTEIGTSCDNGYNQIQIKETTTDIKLKQKELLLKDPRSLSFSNEVEAISPSNGISVTIRQDNEPLDTENAILSGKMDVSPEHQNLPHHLVQRFRKLAQIVKIDETTIEDSRTFDFLFDTIEIQLNSRYSETPKIYESDENLINVQHQLDNTPSEINPLCKRCKKTSVLKHEAEEYTDIRHASDKLKQENDHIRSELLAKCTDINDLQLKIKQLEATLILSESLREDHKILSMQQQDLEKDCNELKSHLNIVNTEKVHLSAELRQLQMDQSIKENQLKILKENLHQLNVDSTQEKNGLLQKILALEGNIDDLQMTCKVKDDAVIDYIAKETHLKTQILELEKRHEEISIHLKNVQLELDQERTFRKQDCDSNMLLIKHLEEEVKERDDRLLDIEKSSKLFFESLNESRGNLASMEMELATLKATIHEKEDSLCLSEQELYELKKSISTLRSERDQLQHHLSESEQHANQQHVLVEKELSMAQEELVRIKTDSYRQLEDFQSKEAHLRSLNKVIGLCKPIYIII
jgi:hypothetical protein